MMKSQHKFIWLHIWPPKILIQLYLHLVEQIPWASFQGGGLQSTTFVSIYQNVRLGL